MTPLAVHQLIDQHFESLSPELQRAARWVRQNAGSLALQSMRSTAREAGVVPATMTRLAQRLGFEGFEELRAPFAHHLATRAPMRPAAQVVLPSRREQPLEPAARINEMQQDNVASVLSLNPPAALRAAARALLEARKVHFLGLRASYGVAFHMHHLFGQVMGGSVLLGDHGGTLSDQVAQIDRDDALVTVSQSPYARQTVEVLRQAAALGAGIVSLTDSALSPTARRVPHVLLYATGTSSFFRSSTGAAALAEALVATVAALGGARTQHHLKLTQERLRLSNNFWERPSAVRAAKPASPDGSRNLATDT